MKLLLVAVTASRVLPNVPNMRLESHDGRQIKSVEDIHLAVDSLGRLSERARNDPAWAVLAQLDGQDWQPNASDDLAALNAPLAAEEKMQAAARAAAHVGQSDAYQAMLSDGGNATTTTVEPAPAAAEGNISAPFAPSVTGFLFGNETTTPAPAAAEAKAEPKFRVPPLLGAQAEVTQAEQTKAAEARKAADAVEAAATAEQNRREAEEKARVEKAKATEEKKKADEVAQKAAADANASAPMATTMAAFSGDLNTTLTALTANTTGHSAVELQSALPMSLLSIRRARPEENVHPWEVDTHPKAYERKRSLLWSALSFGGGISPHHDMPVSRSLSLIEFVHTTHSHTMLMAVVPGLVLLLVCAALVVEGVGLSGMLKGP